MDSRVVASTDAPITGSHAARDNASCEGHIGPQHGACNQNRGDTQSCNQSPVGTREDAASTKASTNRCPDQPRLQGHRPHELCGVHRPQHDPHCMATPSPLPPMDCAPPQKWYFTPRCLSGVSSTLTGSRNLPVHPEESQHPWSLRLSLATCSGLCWCSLTFALSTGLGGGCHPRTTHRPPAPTESLFSLLGAGPIHAPARR